jgi:hypothetical protein
VTELLARAWDADPIVTFFVALAVVATLVGGLVRPKGPDARFVIDVFAYVATLASVTRALTWALRRLAGVAQIDAAPGGTDILLVIGSFGAIFLVSVQGLASLMGGSSEDAPSPLGRMLEAVGCDQRLSPRARRWLGVKGRTIEGESKPSGTP